MGELDDPPARSIPRHVFHAGFFFAPVFDMRDIAMGFDDQFCRFPRISFVCTEILLCLLRRTSHPIVQHLLQLRHIMPMCSGYDQRERGATPVHKDMALAALFFPDPSDSARPSPGPGAP